MTELLDGFVVEDEEYNTPMEDIIYQRWARYNCQDLDEHPDCYWMVLK